MPENDFLNSKDRAIFEREEKFKSLFNGINEPVFVHQLSSEGFHTFLEVNDIACKRYGYSRDEFLQLSPKEISSEQDVQTKGSVEGRRKLKEEGRAIFEAIHTTKAGKSFPVEISSNIYNWLGEKVILSIAFDITERKKTEDRLRESEEKYRKLIENSDDAIFLIYNGNFELVNARFIELFEFDVDNTHETNFNLLNFVAPENRSTVKKNLKTPDNNRESQNKFEFQIINTQGTKLLVEATVNHFKYKEGIASQGILHDITQKRQFEQNRNHSQKMEAIGTLAGGIAHDFNNLLTVINGYSEIGLQKINKSHFLYTNLDSILQAGKKAVKLTSQLIAFSRKQIYRTDILEINNVILELDNLIRRLIGRDININTILGANLSSIKADQSQLEQIFINLVINARDAVYAVDRIGHQPEITIETGEALLNGDNVTSHPQNPKGSHIFMSVSDNGIGMDENIQKKIFEPFFSTKGKSKGTGLGLATVYGIVKQNKGSINVYSEPDQGTTIKIYWPLTSDSAVKAKHTVKPTKIYSGTESVLIVEDDREVARFTVNSLRSLGYNVSEAANGKKALDLFHSRLDDFAIVVTDLIMPEVNGQEFVKQAKKINPSLKVIYVSGYTDNHIAHNGQLEKGVNFIQKPYSIQTLAEKIRTVLEMK